MNWRPLTERPTNMNKPIRSIALSVALVGGLMSIPAGSNAQVEAHRVHNIVLVHGAWADGSGWKNVYDILTKDGYKVPYSTVLGVGPLRSILSWAALDTVPARSPTALLV